MIASAYLRKSNDEGDKAADVKSVAVQRAQIEKLAAAHGWSLDERFVFADDDVSGGIALGERPGGARLMAALATSPAPFQVLIVNEQSRLGREQLDTMLAIRSIERAGVAIWACNTGRPITLNDESSQLLAAVEAWKDESERKRTSKRVRDAAFRRHATGHVAGGTVYGYRNERVNGATVRVIDETEAAIVRRIFTETRDGHGLARIAKRLNAEGVPGPRKEWSPTGVREILHRDLYRGIEIFGRVRRTGPKERATVPESEWVRREAPELAIVDGLLWDTAHAQIAQKAGAFLRRDGKLCGQVESLRGKFLLSGFLACAICGAALIAQQRGRNLRMVYICKAHKERGDTSCSNSTGVPMDRLHAAVIQSLRDTLSPEHFEMHLAKTASDEQARAQRAAERETLIARIPVLSAEAERLANAIAAGSGTLDVLLSAIKARQAEREAAELRLSEIEGQERDLREQRDAVERLRAGWKDWAGALDADPVLTRQLLRKVLDGPLRVRPMGRIGWEYKGRGRYDGILFGSVYPKHPEWTGGTSARYARSQGSAWSFPVPIAGGSDAPAGGDTVRSSEMAPHTPQRSGRPGKPVAPLEAPIMGPRFLAGFRRDTQKTRVSEGHAAPHPALQSAAVGSMTTRSR
jgi:site-specific DNA recombinase